MKANNLKKLVKNRKRSGRGISAGRGKTAGRGTKGQKSRSGYNLPKGFEGGQTPIKKRIPKLGGFKYKRIDNQVVNLAQINNNYDDNETVSAKTLKEKGLIRDIDQPIKILGGDKKLTKKVKFLGLNFSKSAKKVVKSK